MGFIRKTLADVDEKVVETVVELERQKSENWWKGIILGFTLFFLSLGVINFVPGGALPAAGVRYLFVLVLAASWGLLMMSLFLDGKYVTEHANWEPSIGLYVAVVLFFPVVGLLAGLIYLYKRHSYVGVP